MSNIIQKNKIIALIGRAGHGKGTLFDILKQEIEEENFELGRISYSNTFKNQIANSLVTEQVRSDFPEYKDLNNFDFINKLKDDHIDYFIIGKDNMRVFMQKVGTEFYRNIDVNIHAKFEFFKILKNITKNKDVVYVSDDTRFKNELNAALVYNDIQNKFSTKEKADYIKWYIHNNLEKTDSEHLKKMFFNVYGDEFKKIKKDNPEKFNSFLKFLELSISDIQKMDTVKKPNMLQEWDNFKVPETNKMPINEALNLGLIHVFRPILNPNKKYDFKNIKELRNEIMEYTGMDLKDVLNIQKIYENSEVEFNEANIHKNGYARAPINHISETDIDNQKPQAIISQPIKNKDNLDAFQSKIKNLIKNKEWVQTFNNEEENNNEIKISFSFGSLFDTKEAEKVFQEKGVRAYRDHLKEMDKRGEVFQPGPALGLYISLRKLNEQVPDDILNITFGLITRIPPNFPTFLNSYEEWISKKESPLYEFDFITFGEKNIALANKGHKVDLAFTTSKESAKDLFENEIPSMYIPNISAERNNELYQNKEGKLVIVSDFDGVIGSTQGEEAYQRAKEMDGIDPVQYFRDHEIEKKHVPLELGPMGKVFKKLSSVIEENELYKLENNTAEDKYPLEVSVLTARGGAARKRFLTTIVEHNIHLTKLHMMNGLNKNSMLERIIEEYKGANILYPEDGEIHFARSNELKGLLSSLVYNDYTVKKEKELKKTKKLKR